MPFTLAHPAAVVPLARRPFSTLALVAGAVAPDVPYFVRATPVPVTAQSWYEPFTNAATSHSLTGAVPVSLPIALALYLCLLLAVPPVTSLLPGTATRRRGGRGWVVVSLAVGVLTHLGWDSFTHADGYVVTHVAALTTTVAGDLTWARLLQHLSTALGLLVLVVVACRHRARVLGDGPSPSRRRLAVVAVVGALAAVVGIAVTTRSWLHPSPTLSTGDVLEGVLADAALGAGVGVAATVTVGVTAWWVWRLTPAGRRHVP